MEEEALEPVPMMRSSFDRLLCTLGQENTIQYTVTTLKRGIYHS